MENKKPIIGISGGVLIDTTEIYPCMEKIYVIHEYVKSVLLAGGVPVVIPQNNDRDAIKRQVDVIDGLILSGGIDVDPLSYGEEPHGKMGRFMPERDDFEFTLIKYAELKKIPVFGICRGIQVLNVYHGGTLNQDNSLQEGCMIKHSQGNMFDTPSHTVEMSDDSWLHGIFGHEAVVNSFHHQSVKKPAVGFEVTAKARDGIIEAIERTGGTFCVAVQWHPETMTMKHSKMLEMFKSFIDKCRK